MRASSWLCPALTLLCATQLVYAAQGGSYAGYPLNNEVSEMLQSDYFLSKRNKPSLSIVNPLDVLRQRLLLEIARRQMKENSRQVELNRAILKNVGKRATSKYPSPFSAALYRGGELQQQQEADSMQHLQPYEYQIIPTALIFDYLQQLEERRPWLPYGSTAFDNNYMNDATEAKAHTTANANEDDAGAGIENIEQNIIGLHGDNDKHFIKNLKHSNNEHSSHSPNEQHQLTTFQTLMNNRNDDTKTYTLKNNHPFHHHNNNLNLDVIDLNPVSAKPHYREDMTDSDSDYQLQRYLYHLHNNQNHLTRK